ncbi:hypothetical protein FE236_03740 [Mariprofundus erugo]|nr:hypothetical protein FE236_03740 [Mariprofundus erugo]
MTDTEAAAALGRIIDGPITSRDDIEKAESALRAMLLSDYVQVVVPCIKGQHENGYIGYIRLDKHVRNDAAFEAFLSVPSRDLLFATEFVTVSDGKVTESSSSNSAVVGVDVERISCRYKRLQKTSSELAVALPIQLGAFGYYSDGALSSSARCGTAGFIDELYRRVYRPWMEIAQSTPSLFAELKLPPLVAIVLSRAPNRECIPKVLKDLYDELSSTRNELNLMNQMLDKTMNQSDIVAQTNRINESFDAIVPEALLSDATRRKRTIATVFNFIKPVRQLYTIAADPLSINQKDLQEMFKSITASIASEPRIVSRNVPAAKFAELLRVDSVRESILTHFIGSEVKLIER